MVVPPSHIVKLLDHSADNFFHTPIMTAGKQHRQESKSNIAGTACPSGLAQGERDDRDDMGSEFRDLAEGKMGLFDWIWRLWLWFRGSSNQPEGQRVVVTGLDKSGKTAIVRRMVHGLEYQGSIPRDNEVVIGGIRLVVQDVGGNSSGWKASCADSAGIVFVIDASDRLAFDASKAELGKILNDKDLSALPVLILANKIDVAGAASFAEIMEAFQIENLCMGETVVSRISGRPVHLVMTSVEQNFAFRGGFKWLASMVSSSH
jgi:GTPase SAR1 family protein